MTTSGEGVGDEPGTREPQAGDDLRNTVSDSVVSGTVLQVGAIAVHHHPVEPRPVPRQLPAAPAGFVGRQEALAGLGTAMDEASSTGAVFALSGAGGIGKTWLALHWSHEHRHRFPDGQLFVDLRGFSPNGEPMDPAIAMRGFLDALGVEPARIPVDLHAQAALYRSLLAGRRILVVLDNAASAEQVVPLLPGDPGCAALVTSRRRLGGLVAAHSASPVHLDVLDEAESRTVFAAALGEERMAAEPDAVNTMLAVCAGFPLALAVVAARARMSPRRALVIFAGELREAATRFDALDGGEPAASLGAVLSWSLRHLSADQRSLYALLGSAPGPGTALPAVAALTGLSSVLARRTLAALEEASLVEIRSDGRYGMHDLLRDHAATIAEELPHGVLEAALTRVTDFYLHTALAADRLVDAHKPVLPLEPPAAGVRPSTFTGDVAALEWLTAEHATLIAAQRAASTLGRHDVVWHMAWALHSFHLQRRHVRGALATWQAALEAAAHLPDAAILSRTHRLLGNAYSLAGRHEEVTAHLHQALEIAVNDHDVVEQTHTHRSLAFAWARRGDNQQALEHAQRALELGRTLNRPEWEAEALNTAGWYAACAGDFETARDHCRAALALHREHRNRDGEAATLDSLAFIAHRTGEYELALQNYNEAIGLYRAHAHVHQLATTLETIGHVHVDLGQREQARVVWEEALRLFNEQERGTDADSLERRLRDWPG
ncbi:ATP-binding protein [Lentzea sp. NPDC059081]|uniref:ATP-binding protein n=1 Tax=Lentzea sp. NPDC059081 TaxID=3346719 RepID=UPI0036A9355B